MNKKTIFFSLFFIGLAATGIILYLSLKPLTSNSSVETKLVRLDEKATGEITTMIQPYSYWLYSFYPRAYSTETIMYETHSGSQYYLSLATEAQIASSMKLPTASSLYCKNGTAKIFYGVNAQATGQNLMGILFKRGDIWCFDPFVPANNIGEWIHAIETNSFT